MHECIRLIEILVRVDNLITTLYFMYHLKKKLLGIYQRIYME